MATLARRGTGTPATTGTTWATVTNAVDGTVGTDPATYATMTSTTASAVATIEVTGYSFSDTIASVDTLNSVTVALRHFENNTGRFTSVTFQAFDGATAIGTATTCTLATAARTDTATVSATLAQVRSSTFKIRVTITGAASTQSRIFSIDQVDVTADYTPLPPAITQAAYRWYDEGTETGAVALAAQNTAATGDVTIADGIGQLRVRLQSTDTTAIGAGDDWSLQWEKNGSGTWNTVAAAVAAVYDGANSSSFQSSASITRYGQSFLGNGGKLLQASFWAQKFGTPAAGTIQAFLYAHTGTFGSTGVGTGSPLATSTTSISTTAFSTTAGFVNFDFAGTFVLDAGTPYVIAFTSAGSVDGSNMVGYGADTTSPTAPGNFTSLLGTWSAQSTIDLCFRVMAVANTVIPYNSPNLTDAAATTNRLTGGTGSFVAGKISETGWVADLNWTANNYTELLFSLDIVNTDVVNGDTLRFRVLRNGATNGMTYSVTPTINVLAGAASQGITTTGIATTVTFGTPTVAAGEAARTLTGIATTLTFGTPVVAGAAADQNINTTAITTTVVFGTAAVAAGAVSRTTTGIASTLTFGTATVAAGPVTATLTGISSTLTFGTTTVAAGAVARTTTGITTSLTFGTVSVSAGAVNITTTALASTLTFGTPTIVVPAGTQTITTTGIASTVVFGVVTFGPVTAGRFKVWTGSAWADKPTKVWTGSTWVEKPTKVWNGNAWVLA